MIVPHVIKVYVLLHILMGIHKMKKWLRILEEPKGKDEVTWKMNGRE